MRGREAGGGEGLHPWSDRAHDSGGGAPGDCGFAQNAFNRRQHPTIMGTKFQTMAEGARLATRGLWRSWLTLLAPTEHRGQQKAHPKLMAVRA